MENRINIGRLKIDKELYDLVHDEIAPGTDIDADEFWHAFDNIVKEFAPENRALLEKRDRLQQQLDKWYLEHKDRPIDHDEYVSFLTEISYLVPEGEDFIVSTENVDLEIALIAGPQLVVPVDNARYALNATNARWGSLYDALYGTNAIDEKDGATRDGDYNPIRGAKVIAYTEQFLDEVVSLETGNYADITNFKLRTIGHQLQLRAILKNGEETGLEDPTKFVGFSQDGDNLSSILFQNHGLHIEIQIDREHPIGKEHPAGVCDVILESAITTIQDCEDSVAAVDAVDKVRVYRNWNGIMKGTLETTFEKNGKIITRRLKPDKTFTTPDGNEMTISGRSLLLIRNVGLHIYTDAVTTSNDEEIPEGFLDAMITTFGAMHDIKRNSSHTNSRTGSIYIVKPKFHGPEEVDMTIRMFCKIEDALGLPHNTIKIGIMDEERRTTVNLKEVLRIASERLVFINTGFLDRTGDEIHTSMHAGAMIPKMDIRNEPWMRAYEDWNVDIGIETGLPGINANFGKGMWTKPDEMAEMLETKQNHPLAGATTAWVPSPTAATLHAIHYHKVNVENWLNTLALRERASMRDLLTPPLLKDRKLTSDEIQREMDNNAQGILGYVVRWVDQGIGCSKIPDINNVGLMEDRATLRISSQHIANWLHHGIVTKEQVRETFERMARIVDEQNSEDSNYIKMSPNYDESVAFQAALDLVFKGCELPNGYTEFVLHPRRREAKLSRKPSA